MDSFFFNKVAGAVLGTILVGFVIVEVSHKLYPNPREGGHHGAVAYDVPGMEAGHGEGGHEVEVVQEVNFLEVLAQADADAGAREFRACQSCHNAEPGAGAKTGPNLWNVVNRPIASVDGFPYSRAMAGHGGTWDFETLGHFIESPSGYINGTGMSFGGLRQDGRRANLIAYLATLRDGDPVPLPNLADVQEAAAPAMDHSEEVMDHASEAMDDTGAAMEQAVEEAEMADDAAVEAMDGHAGDAMEDMPREEMQDGDGSH